MCNNLDKKLSQHLPSMEEINIQRTLEGLPRKHVLLYSPTGMQKAGIDPKKLSCHTVDAKTVGIQITELHALMLKFPSGIGGITVFGSGTTIDAAKYCAMICKVPLFIIPSILSVNAAGTTFACLDAEGDTKTTINTGLAEKILMDINFLRKQGSLNMRGMSDVFSIATALRDWEIAFQNGEYNQDPKNIEAYTLAKKILEEAMGKFSNPEELNCYTSEAVRDIARFIWLSAAITTLHGSGRPESGSEHIFSKLLELSRKRNRNINTPHGISVGTGILLMAKLQENPLYGTLANIYEKTRMLKSAWEDRAFKDDTAEVLSHIQPHYKRGSIVNTHVDNLHNESFRNDLINAVMNDGM